MLALPSPNSSHTSRLISGIRLRTVLEIRIWASRTIHTNIPCGIYVRAPMRLRHYRNHGNATRRSYWFGLQPIVII